MAFWFLNNINLNSRSFNFLGRSRSSRNGPMPPTPLGLSPSTQSETPKRTNSLHPQVPVNTQFNTISGSIAAGVVAPPVAVAAAAAGKKRINHTY